MFRPAMSEINVLCVDLGKSVDHQEALCAAHDSPFADLVWRTTSTAFRNSITWIGFGW